MKQFLSTYLGLVRGDDITMENSIDNQHLSVIEKAIKEIQFGEVQISIQDGKIVQVNRIEKHRFTKAPQQKQNKLIIK